MITDVDVTNDSEETSSFVTEPATNSHGIHPRPIGPKQSTPGVRGGSVVASEDIELGPERASTSVPLTSWSHIRATRTSCGPSRYDHFLELGVHAPSSDSLKNPLVTFKESREGGAGDISHCQRWMQQEQDMLLASRRVYFKVTCMNTATIIFRTNGAGELGGFCCTVTADAPETTVATTEGTTQNQDYIRRYHQCQRRQNLASAVCRNRGELYRGKVVTEKNEYPWLVALSTAGGSNHPFCGGSVYNSEWVVTAAHCVDGRSASELEILYNMWDWTDSAATQVVTKPVAEIIMHPQYDGNTIDNDIALIRVSSAVDLTLPGIMPVCLPSSTDNYAGQNGIVTGWGTLSSGGDQPNQAYEVTVPIRPQSECVSSLPSGYITSNMICAGLPEGGIRLCQVTVAVP
ncbi:enteropeptidase-like [Penaeus japonicus]|uniref:enteropeptidase-like n=1 Tax=Penaeus japonicus TaxID=27405 RepID=UPI001C7175EE|nr:enteropeptidase-like [Penaeus japonicus]